MRATMSRQKGTASFAALNGMPTITTALRIKPCWEAGNRRRRTVPVRGQQASYVFDAVLDAATQQQAYQHLCAPLVDGLLSGQSSVLLLYGASQSGKTYTLHGGSSCQDAGVAVQAVQALARGLSIVPKNKYRLSASYCGLTCGHDAQLLDLLAAAPEATTSLNNGSAAAALASLSSWTLEEPADILEVLRCRKLQQSLVSGPIKAARTLHTMLTLQLDSFDTDRNILSSKHLSFVELAAPEPKDPLGMGRNSENATARSLAMTYNSLSKVLLSLRNSAPAAAAAAIPGAAAAALAAGSLTSLQQLQHVPWRDSALTRWLQERLHAANTITLVGTVSSAVEAAADTVATISWVSRFSSSSKTGTGGTLVSFAWEVAADPEATGSYVRFHPEQQVVRDPQTSHAAFVKQQQQRRRDQQQAGRDSPMRQRASTPAGGSYCGPAYSSPMVNQCSPNLPNDTAPHSAASISNAVRMESRMQQQLLQQRQQHSADNTPVKRQIDQWQHQQQRLQTRVEAAGVGCADQLSIPTAAVLQSGDDVDPVTDTGRVLADEVVLYGELMAALRRAGGGLRAETILQQLLQELGGTRAALSADRGELKLLRAHLTNVQEQHADCDQAKQLLQDHNRELQQKLQAVQKTLDDASADRDLFLKRLQQLEADADGDGSGRPSSRLEMQRQKAHAAQLRTMEAELNALASSNQQLRSQLELATQQMSRSKLAAQSSADNTEQLQQEVEVLRAAADIEGDIRRELETSVEQLQRACEATAHELAAVTAGKVSLQQQHEQAQESIDALAAELQDTLVKVEEKESEIQALAEQLEIEQRQNVEASQQLSALQTQVSALEEATQQQQQQQQQQAVEEELLQQQTSEALQQIIQDLQDVFNDFEQDLDATLPQHWKQLLPTQNTSSNQPGSASPDTRRSRRLRSGSSHLTSGAGNRHSSSAHRTAPGRNGAGPAVESSLPYEWARTLQAVVAVIQLAVDERAQAAEEMQGSVRRAELLDRNVEELRKLVSTQENLQQQLAEQLSASQQEFDAAAAHHAAEQQKLQASLDEAQTAVSALADELQECQAQLKAAQDNLSERDQALDVLADEFVELSTAQDGLVANNQELDEQVQALAAELEEALLQLNIRDQVFDQVWGQLRGLPQHFSSNNDNHNMQGSDRLAGWDNSESNLPKSAALDRLHRQQLQGQLHQQRRRSILDDGVAAGNTAAGLAQQAVRAARRRSSAGGEAQQLQHQQQGTTAQGSGLLGRGAGERRSQAEQDSTMLLQDNSRARWPSSSQNRQLLQQGNLKQGKQDSQQVQPLVVAAVQRLCSQVTDLQQQLAEASVGSIQSSKLQQQLKDLRQQYAELAERLEQQEQDDLLMQTKYRQLGQQLRAKEMEAEQSQERCQELINSLKQVQQHLQQQQQAPPAPTTPSLAQQQAELQLIDCRHHLADAQARLAETSSALAAEKAARMAAEDAEANRQQLLARLGALQEELSGLHAQLLAEKKEVAAVREELALMTTSRDTWRDSAKRAEAAAAAAEEAAETKTADLTRARAEVHNLKQQLSSTTQQLELLQLQAATQKASESTAADGLAEGLAARLAAAQVMRREAEDRAAELSRRLAAAEQQLEDYQQQQGDEQVELAQQLTVQEAQLARSKADSATQRAAAEAASAQLAEVTRQLTAVQAERDKLQQQVMSMQAQQSSAVLQLPMQLSSIQQLQPQSVTSLHGHLQDVQQPHVQQHQQLVPPLPAGGQLAPTQQEVLNVQQQQPIQQQHRPSAASIQPWTTLGAAVSYESMVAPVAALSAATGMVDGLSSTQQAQDSHTQSWQQVSSISSNNPFYHPQTHTAAASKSQAAGAPSHRTPTSERLDASAASVPPGSRFLGGLFSGWKSGSSPGAVEVAAGGVSTPNAHAGGQQRVTYSSSGGGRSSSAGGGVSVSHNNSGAGGHLLCNSAAGNVEGPGGVIWETATRDGASQHRADGQDAAESPCMY